MDSGCGFVVCSPLELSSSNKGCAHWRAARVRRRSTLLRVLARCIRRSLLTERSFKSEKRGTRAGCFRPPSGAVLIEGFAADVEKQQPVDKWGGYLPAETRNRLNCSSRCRRAVAALRSVADSLRPPAGHWSVAFFLVAISLCLSLNWFSLTLRGCSSSGEL